ncbi:alanine racemase [Phyllobacterium sp. 22229]|uniref:alanine racemase n=1 Tax=Phyllobacterium sp. 22229 TaxID=3453895 RepID=UPI003F833829
MSKETNNVASPRYEISHTAIRDNFRRLRALLAPETHIFCCLKRDGYGCGAKEVARVLADAGADGFAVAALADAMRIRSSGVKTPILLYGGTLPDQIASVEEFDLTITIGSANDAKEWNRRVTRKRPAFIKIDVGLLRFGFSLAELADFLNNGLHACDQLVFVGVYTHLSERTDIGHEGIEEQKRIFDHAVMLCRQILPDLDYICASSSETIISYRALDYNTVDVGALLFGLTSQENIKKLKLKGALSAIKSHVTTIKSVVPDLPSSIDIPPSVKRLGVVTFGWGDGFPKRVSEDAFVLVNGELAKVLIPVHLEQIRIDLTHIKSASIGDEVVLLGDQADQSITAFDLAQQWSVDPEEIYCAMREHIPKIYV